MNYGPPTGHFASDFSAVWHNLTWSLVDNDNKLPEAEINVTTGLLKMPKEVAGNDPDRLQLFKIPVHSIVVI
jgi:hypothetical protein